MLQVSQSQESPLLSTLPVAAADPGHESAKKRSSSKVSRLNIEILLTLSKALLVLKIFIDITAPAQQFC